MPILGNERLSDMGGSDHLTHHQDAVDHAAAAAEKLPVDQAPSLIGSVLTFITGTVARWLRRSIDVQAYGATADTQHGSDGAMTSGSAVLTSASNPFAATDVDKVIRVSGAGAAGAALITTIASFQSAGQVTLAANASATVANKDFSWGTDNTSAVQTAGDSATGNLTLVFGPGTYMFGSGLAWNKDSINLIGDAASGTILHFLGTGVGVDMGDGVATRNGLGLRNLTLKGEQSRPSIGLRCRKTFQILLDGVHFTDFPTLADLGGGNMRLMACQWAQNSVLTLKHLILRSVANVTISSPVFEGLTGATADFIEIASSGNSDIAIEGVVGREAHGRFIWISQSLADSVLGLTVTGVVRGGTIGGIDANGAASLADGVFDGLVLIGTSATGNGLRVGTSGRAGGCIVRGFTNAAVITGVNDIGISNCYLSGSTRAVLDNAAATGIVADNTIGGGTMNMAATGIRYYRNKGVQPQGTATISVGASPFTYTAGNTPEVVYIRGGTVSDISKNGRTIFTQTEQTVVLEPGEAVVVTYSVAPTMEKDRK